MADFLQTFSADDHLLDRNDAQVTRCFLHEAVKVALLGSPDGCSAICKVLLDHGLFDFYNVELEFQCIWAYSASLPPEIEDASGGAIWVPSERVIRSKELDARNRLYLKPDWVDWDSIDAEALDKMRKTADDSLSNPDPARSQQHNIELVSSHYATVIHMASEVGRHDVIADLMPLMARRAQVHKQMELLSMIPCLWRDYFLKGWLRDWLSLTETVVEEYTTRVVDTARKRFEHGPYRPEDIYPGYTIAQLLDVIDKNTVSCPDYAEYLAYERSGEKSPPGTVIEPRLSILHPGATSEEIAAVEVEFGFELPSDLKEFYRLSNGCDLIRQGEGYYIPKLVPLDRLEYGHDGIFELYGLQVVPELPLKRKVNWPDGLGPPILMYEQEGSATCFMWMCGAEDIKASKRALKKVYKKASADDKAIIDRSIRYWYGDRETYDKMTDHCYWDESRESVHPNFTSFLARVACESRHFSPRVFRFS